MGLSSFWSRQVVQIVYLTQLLLCRVAIRHDSIAKRSRGHRLGTFVNTNSTKILSSPLWSFSAYVKYLYPIKIEFRSHDRKFFCCTRRENQAYNLMSMNKWERTEEKIEELKAYLQSVVDLESHSSFTCASRIWLIPLFFCKTSCASVQLTIIRLGRLYFLIFALTQYDAGSTILYPKNTLK